MTTIDNVQLIEVPKAHDVRGNLSVVEGNTIPFEIKRVYYLYDIPTGSVRGGHAHKNLQQLLVALSGSFDVLITNCNGTTEKFSLNRSYYGLYLPAKTWRHIENFSTNALALHVSSKPFSKEDYIRDFENFKKLPNEY